MTVSVINKATHQQVNITGNELTLQQPSVVEIAAKRGDVQSLVRQGDTLIITLVSGVVIKIHGFFPDQGASQSDVVLKDDHDLWLTQFSDNGQLAGQYTQISSIEPLLAHESFDLSTWAWVLGGVALAGAAAGGGGGGGGHHDSVPPDTTAPNPPTFTVVTNPNGSVTLSGQSEAGSTVTVVYPDGSKGTVVTGADGNFSIVSLPNQPTGTITAGASDAAGNTSGNTTNHYVDVTPPAAPTVSVASNPDGSVTVTGKTEPGDTVTVTYPDGTTGSVTAGSDGTYSIVSPPGQPSGEISVGATDPAGNKGTDATVPFTDTTPPAAPTVVVATNPDGSVTVGGHTDPGNTVTVTYPDGSTGTVTAGPDGNYSITSPANQPSGEVSAAATDPAGNTGSEALVPFVDTTPPGSPTVAVTTNPDGSVTVGGHTDSGNTVTVTYPDGSTGTVIAGPDGTYTIVSPPNQPTGQITAGATDPAGNTGAGTTVPFTDTTPPGPPTVVVTTDPDGSVTVGGQAEPGSTVTVTFPDGSTGTSLAGPDGSYSAASPPNQPDGTITAEATDPAGNGGTATSQPYTDITAPAAPTIVATPESNGTVLVTGHTDPGNSVKVIFPDGSSTTVVAAPDGSYSANSPANQPTGEVKAQAFDSSGNGSTDATAVFTDTTAPDAPSVIVATNPDGSVTVTGQAEPGTTVNVTYPDGTIGTVTAGTDGSYSVTSPVDQPTGNVVAAATDAAGNTSPTTTSTYTDTTAPVAPTVNIATNPDGSVTVTGQAEPHTTVHVTYPDGTTGTVTAGTDGSYSVTSPIDQPSGNVVAGATDAAGNTSPTTTVPYADTTAPAAPTVIVATNPDGSVTVTGQAEPNTTVKVIYPDGTTGTVMAGTDGSYSVTSPIDQPSGNVVAGATDTAGNTSPTTTVPYADTTAPAAPTVIVATNPDGSVTVTGQAEPNTTVHITYPDGTTGTVTAGTDGSYSVTSPIDQPSGNVVAGATDTAGNTSPTTTVPYADTTAPVAPTVIVASNPDGSVTVTGQAEPNTTVKVIYPDGTTGTVMAGTDGSYSVTSPVDQPTGNVVAGATDAAGNTSPTTTATYTDTTAPVAPTVNVATNPDGSVTVTGQAEPHTTVHVTYPDGTTGTVTVGTDGSYSVTSPIDQPSGNVVAGATDAAGNNSPTTTAPYTDITAPEAPTVNVTINADGSLTVTGHAEPDSIVKVTYPDGTSGTVQAGADGSYSVQSPVSQPTGDVVAGATDAAGNHGLTTSVPYVDTIAPTTTGTIDSFADNVGPIQNPAAPSGTKTDDTTPTLNGSLTAALVTGEVLNVYRGATLAGTATVTGTTWTFTDTTPSDGSYTYTVRVADASGNLGTVSNNFNLTVDTTAPSTADGYAVAIVNFTDDVAPQTGVQGAGTSTNDTAPLLNGSVTGLQAGDVVRIYEGTSLLGTATVSGGTWSFQLAATTEGVHSYTAKLADAAGNEGLASAPFSLTVDTTAPSAGTGYAVAITVYTDDQPAQTGDFASGSTTNDTSPLLQGTVNGLQTGDLVRIYEGTTLLGTATVTGSSWTYQVTGATDGLHTYTAKLADAAGNEGLASNDFALTVDTSVPSTATGYTVAITAYTDDVVAQTGDFASGTSTNDTTPLLKGSVTGLAAGDIVRIYEGATLLGTATVTGTDWTFQAIGVTEGLHTYTAKLADAAGNEGLASNDFSLTVDTSAPSTATGYAVAIATFTDDVVAQTGDFTSGTSTNDSAPLLNGTVSGLATGDIVRVYEGATLLGTATVTGNTWTFQVSGAADGLHTYTAKLADAAGNEGLASNDFSLTVDTSAPSTATGYAVAITAYNDDVVTQVGDFGDGTSTNDTSPLLEGTVTGLVAGDIVRIYEGATLLGTATVTGNAWTFQVSGATEGLHTYTAKLADAAGNEGLASTPFNLTVDTIAPGAGYTVAINTYTDDVAPQTGDMNNGTSTNDTSPLLSGSVTGLATGDIVRIYEGTTLLGTATVSGNTWTFQVTGAAEGNHTYVAKLADAAGNEGLASNSFSLTVDTVAPSAPGTVMTVSAVTGDDVINASESGNALSVTGTITGDYSVGDVVTVVTSVGTYTGSVLAGGAWQVNVPAGGFGATGNQTLQASIAAHDAAGNVGTITASHDYVVNTSPPTGTAISIDVIAQDDIINQAESTQAQTISGKVTGEFTPGDTLTLAIGSFTSTPIVVAADGTWSISIPASTMLAGTDVLATLLAHSAVGNAAQVTVDRPYVIDVTPPNASSTVIDFAPVTDLNIVNAAESVATNLTLTGKISGDFQPGDGFQPGDVITLTINGNTYSGTVAASGGWTVTGVAGADLAADADRTISASLAAHDNAGNLGIITGSHGYSVETGPVDAGLVINTIAGDNMINSGEMSVGSVVFSGLVTGTFQTGDLVTLVVNGNTFTGITVDATGAWSQTVTSAQLGADGGYTATASVVATDGVGNSSTVNASHDYAIDTSFPNGATTTFAINDITADNQINLAESGAQQTISGTVSGDFTVGDAVTVTIGSNTYNTTVTAGPNATGVWSVSVPGSVLAGVNVVNASLLAHDPAGNPGTVLTHHDYVVDISAPTAPTLNVIDDQGAVTGNVATNGGVTDDTTPTYQGVGEPGAVISLVIDGGAPILMTVPGSGAWSYQTPAPIALGAHTVSVTQTDNAGNPSGTTSSTFTVSDAAVPPPTLVVTDDVAPVTGAVPAGGVTNDTLPTLSGTGVAGSTISVSINGGTAVTVLVDGTNNWTYTPTVSIGADGAYTVSVTQTTNLGLSAPVASTFTLDTSAPSAATGYTVAIAAYTDDVAAQTGDFTNGTSTNDTTPLLKGTVGGLATGDIVRIYEGATLLGNATVTGGTWTFQIATASEGGHTYTAKLADAAGNEGLTSNNFSLTVDTSAPSTATGYAVAITAYTDDVVAQTGDFSSGTSTNDTTPLLKGSVTGLATGDIVRLYEGATLLGTATVTGNTWTFQVSGAAEGLHTYTAKLADAAGNEGLASNNFALTVDTSAPSTATGYAVSIVSYTDDVVAQTGNFTSGTSTNDTTPLLNGTVTGLATGDIVRIYEGATLLGTATVTGNSWSFQLPVAAEGAHVYTAKLADAAGNEGLASNNFSLTVDTTAPSSATGYAVAISAYTDDVAPQTGSFASGTSTNDTTPLLTGTVAGLATGDIVRIYEGSTLLGTATVTGSTWSFQVTGATEGAHSYVAKLADAAGNEGLASNTFNLTVDTTAPTQTTVISNFVDDVGTIQGTFASGTTTDDTAPVLNGTFTGTLAAGEVVRIYDGSTLLGTATVTGNNWTFSGATGLVDGTTHNFHAVVADSAGNEGTSSTNFTLIIDTTPPTQVATIATYTDNVGLNQGNYASGTTTDDTTPVLNGTLSAAIGATDVVRIYDGSTLLGNATVTGTTWTFAGISGLLDASTHTYTAKVTDVAGNEGTASNAFTLSVDITPPAVTAIVLTTSSTDTAGGLGTGTASTTNSAVNSDFTTRDSTLTISGTYAGTLAASGEFLQISADGGLTWSNVTFNNSSHTWSYLDTVQRLSAVTYQLRAVDSVGNQSAATTSQLINVDLLAPIQGLLAPVLTTAFDSFIKGDGITTNTSLTFTSATNRNAEAGSTVLLVNDVNNDGVYSEGIDSILASAVVAANGSWSLTGSGLALGTYHLGLMQVDAAGNRTRLSVISDVSVVGSDNASNALTTWGGTFAQYDTGGATATLGTNGLWSFFQTTPGAGGASVYNSTSLTGYTQIALPGGGRWAVGATFADFARTGFAGIVTVTTDAGNQDFWSTTNGTTYTRNALTGSLYYGGVAAYDKTGDGYLDFAMGDNFGNSLTFVTNTSGTLTFMNGTATSGEGRPTGVSTAIDGYAEVSGVDLENNGTVDIVEHTNANGNYSLTTFKNDQSTTNTFTLATVAGVFATPNAGNSNVPVSMTWADFNGDGYMDLYLNTGRNAGNTADSTASRIYWNNGSGGFGTSAGTTGGTATYFSDTLNGGASVAVDWNHDGKMDVIELPTYGVAASPTLYQNLGGGTFATGVSVTGATTYNTINGAETVDYNWDGSQDLLIYNSAGNTVFVQNTNTVANGTSLHLRIVDANGLNVLFGNTVQLYNSKGVLVSSQILNPQSGIGTNDSSGLVYFYGLNAAETYTAVLVRSIGGISSDVGGLASLGGNTIENVNASWTGLVAGAATSDYVLSAESGTSSASGTFIGTGYNDIFFASAGTDTYNGSGGWANARFGTPVWSATLGEDIVDFKLAGATGVTVNLNTTTAQNTGFNTATFSSIEGLYGSAGNDTFIASTTAGVNTVLQGRGGNDNFTVTGGGHTTLLYTVLNSTDATGGNGTDTVTGFTVGSVASTATADVLDLTSLLSSYTGTTYVFKDAISGQFVLDYASKGINQYLQVTNDGTNTTVSVDLTGTGNFGAGHNLVTLGGVVTDLPTLLANNQLLVSSSNNLNSVVGVTSQTTTDTTPIVSGTIPYALTNGAHMEVTIGGVTYSSANGAVVVDPLNNTWYVQVPAGLATGTYDVSAVVLNSDGSVASQDISHNELSVAPAPTVTFGGAGSGDNKGTAVALGENGQWMIFSNQIIFNGIGSNSSTLGNYSSTSLTSSNTQSGNNLTQNVTFVDYNRDGHMDLLGEDSVYADGQQGWTFNGTTYTPFQVGLVDSAANNTANGTTNNPGANAYAWYGGVAAYDKNGDGFVDVVYGDNTPDDENAQGGYDSSFVVNQNGTINGFVKDSNYVSSPTAAVTPVATNTNNSTPDKEISGIDINNDGTVDIVYHGSVNTNKVGALTSSDNNRLVVVTNSGNGLLASTQIVNGVFYNQESTSSQAPSMTWADYNGDGFMDLFLGVTDSASTATSMIFFNDGAGHLSATNATTTGIGTATNTYSMGDTLMGGPSLAMDWSGDGKMDIIELPQYGATGTVNLYTNNSTSTTPSFATTQLLASGAFGSGTGATFGGGAGGSVTGAIGIDLDWDGAKDLLVFTTNGVTTYVHNPTVVAAGTSLHVRIVDANGINAYYGNTVQLVDSTGKVVASQVINPQSGNQTNDSTGIVDFYGLSASQTYSVVLLKNVNGLSSDVGGVASDTTGVNGGGTANIVENVNSTWAGLTTGAANHGYVLTAANGTSGASDVNAYTGLSTGGSDIVGTGYNDTFFAQTGTSAYNGGGGTTTVSGVQAWSNTGGLDIVDYKLAGSTALTIDLSNTVMQSTGYNTASFKNIEGIVGGSGNDTFTDSLVDNQFEGRGGNDTFNLTHGGHDTLLYNVLAGASADGTGGNGSDIVNGFKVGTWEGTAGTQRLDVHALLVGYTGDGSASYINNVATINASAGNIGSFLQVTQSGANTVVSIDRDGAGTAYAPTTIATLQNVHTDLATLLANHQLTVV